MNSGKVNTHTGTVPVRGLPHGSRRSMDERVITKTTQRYSLCFRNQFLVRRLFILIFL